MNPADEKEGLCIQARFFADFPYAFFSEAQGQSHTIENPQEREVRVQKVRHLHSGAHSVAFMGASHSLQR
jgi:biotin carboxylase